MAAPTILKINGVTMPTPAVDGVEYTREPIWSADAGRTASGKAVGNVIAYKWKLVVHWPPLTFAQAKTIDSNVSKGSDDFKRVVFLDPFGTSREITAYCGTPSYTIHTSSGPRPVRNVSIDIIEQ